MCRPPRSIQPCRVRQTKAQYGLDITERRAPFRPRGNRYEVAIERCKKQGRRDLRAELERRVASDGYKMADIFPELGTGASSGARRKWPAKYRNPQNPDTTWSGIGRTPKWVQAILDERGIDRAAFKSIPMYQIHASS